MNSSSTPRVRALVRRMRDTRRERRAARAAYQSLRQELASYGTSREVDDLLGSIKDQESAEAQQVREILLDNLR